MSKFLKFFGFRHSEESEALWEEYYKQVVKNHKDPYTKKPNESEVIRALLIETLKIKLNKGK